MKIFSSLALFMAIFFWVSYVSELNAQPKNEGDIIWYHNIHYSDEASLKKILDTGLITHVMFALGHRYDFNYKTSIEIKRAVQIIKDANVKLIWTRPLWPVDKKGPCNYAVIYNSDYYINEIRQLNIEASDVAADYTGFDIEPYGNAPMKSYLKGENRSSESRKLIKNAIEAVVSKNYLVDYILPAGAMVSNSPYDCIALMGKKKISEDTYYFYLENKWERIQYQFDIAGVYLVANDNNPTPSKIRQILSAALHNWGKTGVLLYPKEDSASLMTELIYKSISFGNVN